MTRRWLMLGVIAAVCVSACGCAEHGQQKVNYIVPIECLTKPVRLVGCDQTSPPSNCKKSIIELRKACEQVDLRTK